MVFPPIVYNFLSWRKRNNVIFSIFKVFKFVLAYFFILCNKNGIKGLWGHKGPTSLGLGPALVLQRTLPWAYNTPNMALYILAIFLHSMQRKLDQRTLGTQGSTLIGSRACSGPSMDPAMALQYTKHGPLYFGYIFAFYATKKGSRDSGDTNVNPHWV